MKNLMKICAAILLIVGFSTTMIAQNTSKTVTGTTAGAKLVVAMGLVQDSPLHFGSIAISGTAGTCILATGNTRSVTGGVALSAATPTSTNAGYHVTGTMNATYAVTLPATITVTETAGALQTMTISDLKARFNGAATDAITSKLSATGTDNFSVGGTLGILATQEGGEYAGTFNVTVDYN
jgi:hypothetical protein